MKNYIKSVKHAIESDNIVLTKVVKCRSGQLRIDARARFPQPDQNIFFSKYVKRDYANRLYKEKTGRNIEECSVYYY